jgi:hypothetical protein
MFNLVKLLIIGLLFLPLNKGHAEDFQKFIDQEVESPFKACQNITIISKKDYSDNKSKWDSIKNKCHLDIQLIDDAGIKNLNPLKEGIEYLNFSQLVANRILLNLRKSQDYATCSSLCFSGQEYCMQNDEKILCMKRKKEIIDSLKQYSKEIRKELALANDSNSFINVNIYNAATISMDHFVNNNLRDFDLTTPNPVGRNDLSQKEYLQALKTIKDEREVFEQEAKKKNVIYYREWMSTKLMKNMEDHQAKYRSLIYEHAPIFGVIDHAKNFDIENNPVWSDFQIKTAFDKLKENAILAEKKVNWSIANGKLEFKRSNGEALKKFTESLLSKKNEDNELLYYIGMKNQVEEILKENPSKCAIATAMINRIESKDLQNNGVVLISTLGAGTLLRGASLATTNVFRIGRALTGAEASALTGMSLGSITLADSINKYNIVVNEAETSSGLNRLKEGVPLRSEPEIKSQKDYALTSTLFFPIDIFTGYGFGKKIYSSLSEKMFSDLPELKSIIQKSNLDELSKNNIVDKWLTLKIKNAFKNGILNEIDIENLRTVKNSDLFDKLASEIEKNNPTFFNDSKNIDLFLKAISKLGNKEKLSPDVFKNISITLSKLDLEELRKTNRLDAQLKLTSIIDSTIEEMLQNQGHYTNLAKDENLQLELLSKALKRSGLIDKVDQDLLAQCTIPEKIAPDNNPMCFNFLNAFFSKNMIKRIGNNYQLKKVSDFSTVKYYPSIYQEKFKLMDGAIINTRDIDLGKTLKDDKGRSWRVTTINNSNGYFELTGNGYIYKGNYLQISSNPYHQYELTVDGLDKKIPVLISDTDKATTQKYLDIAHKIIKETPKGYFEYTHEVVFANAPSIRGFEANGTFGVYSKEIIILPRRSLRDKFSLIAKTFWHEQGHSYVSHLMYKPGFEAKWMAAIRKDNRFVTEYAKTNYEEDFCETIAYYILEDGGRSKTKWRTQFANRFTILDEIFNADPKLKEQFKRNLLLKQIGKTTLIIAGPTLYYFKEDEPKEEKEKENEKKEVKKKSK